jgi:hypothetical protein
MLKIFEKIKNTDDKMILSLGLVIIIIIIMSFLIYIIISVYREAIYSKPVLNNGTCRINNLNHLKNNNIKNSTVYLMQIENNTTNVIYLHLAVTDKLGNIVDKNNIVENLNEEVVCKASIKNTCKILNISKFNIVNGKVHLENNMERNKDMSLYNYYFAGMFYTSIFISIK